MDFTDSDLHVGKRETEKGVEGHLKKEINL